MDRGGRALREAIQQYLEAIQSEPGHSWLSAAAHALEGSTRKGYAAALRRLRKHSREQFGASPRQVLELEIKEMVASENAEGNLKKLLSACRQLDKLRLQPRIVEAGDWQVVKWLAKRRVRGESALVRWAPMELFVWLAEQIVDLESAEIVALEGGSLPVSPRITATRRTRGPAKDGCTSRFRWTEGGVGRAERSSTGQKNDLWTICGQDGSERICKTLHLSDALGLRRVRSAQRDGKEANPWSPRVPRAQSTTASPAAKENTGSRSVTGDVLGGFGGQVERLMRLPDVPRKQEGLVAGGLMALGRLAATIDLRRGLARLTQALETISEEGLSQASEESYYDDDELEPVSLQLARRGIGEVGKVRMANTILRRCVPKDLLRTYQACDRKYASGIPMVDSPAVGDMLSAIRDAGPLKKCSEARGTSKARVIPKNSQKCALIFACVGLNDADWRKPP